MSERYFKSDESHECFERGGQLSDEGRHKDALAEFEKLTELEPNDPYTFTLVAWSCTNLCEELEAKAAQACSTGCCGLPITPEKKEVHEKAVAALQKAIGLGRRTADEYYSLYWHYHGLGKHGKGLEACREALQIDPENLNAQWGMASAHFYTGNFEKAAEAYRKVIALDPACRDAYKWLIRIMLMSTMFGGVYHGGVIMRRACGLWFERGRVVVE